MPLHQKPGTTILSLAALVFLAAGFVAGWWVGRKNWDGSQESRRTQAVSSVGISPDGHPLKSDVLPAAKQLFEGPAATDGKAAEGQFRDALRTLDRLTRMRNMLVILDKMRPENGQAYLDGWLAYVNQNGPPIAEAQLFDRKIGEVLGPVVVGQRTGTAWDMKRVRNAVRDQFIGWMKSDPVAAKNWMDGLQNEPFREQLVDAYVAATAERDLKASLDFLQGLPEDLQARSAGVIIEAAKAEKTQTELGLWMNEVVSRAGENKNAPWLHATFNALMQNFVSARMCGESAAAIYEQHEGQPYSDSHWGPELAGAYARSDATAGLAWAMKMAPSSNPGMIDAAVAAVQPEKLDEAFQWSQSLTGGAQRDRLINKIAERFDSLDPAKAARARAALPTGP